MSVKQEKMTKTSTKNQVLHKRKEKQLNFKKGNKVDQKAHIKSKVKSPLPTNNKSPSNLIGKGANIGKRTNEVMNDKLKKLKDRKKFKRMKALKKLEKAEKIDNVAKNSKSVPGLKHTDELKKNVKKLKTKDIDQKGEIKSKIKTSSDDKKILSHEKKKLKRLKWKQKQMGLKLARKGLVNTQQHKLIKTEIGEKVELPKTADGATANWKKLQETMSAGKGESRKRKIPENRLRNPKYQKKEEKQGEDDSKEKENSDEETDIWFDDVDEILLDKKPGSLKQATVTQGSDGEMKEENPLIKPGAFKGVTKIVCMDCEMVGVGDGSENMLARVSIVNQYGEPVYDKFVKPKEEVTDYRTFVSGVRPEDLKNAENFEQVQKEVADILKGKTLVGHAIQNDLKVLYLKHPRKRIRDTSQYKRFRQLSGGRTPSLKKLSEKILAVKVQEGEHNSIQDAQATMRLYTMHRKQWENDILSKKKEHKKKKKGNT